VNDPEFEARLRRELHDAAEQVEPQRTLADLRRRIKIWRLFHRHPRRLRHAARSTPDPPTETMPRTSLVWRAGPVPVSTDVSSCQPVPRCVCGRPSEPRWPWCCWVCRAATDGGWSLGPWRPGLHWTAAHTWACEQRRQRHAAVAWRRTDDPPMPHHAMPTRGPRPPADVRDSLALGPPTPPAGGLLGVSRPRVDRHPRPGPGPAGSYPGGQLPDSRGGLMPSCTEAGCPRLPAAATACHCHVCHQTFGTLTLFDSHQVWEAGWAALSCRRPLSLGLVLDHNGTWQTPQGLQRRQQDRLRLVARGRHR